MVNSTSRRQQRCCTPRKSLQLPELVATWPLNNSISFLGFSTLSSSSTGHRRSRLGAGAGASGRRLYKQATFGIPLLFFGNHINLPSYKIVYNS